MSIPRRTLNIRMREAQPGAEQRKRWTRGTCLIGGDDDGGAEQRGDRVQLLAEDRGRLAEQDVTQHAAADARDGAEECACTGPSPNARALVAPVTQKTASPRASKSCT